ncbi:pentapeptide repeat-containing protein [Oculatella sp. LEGE 06141]|uniref:pentapeptide repeat-containing protein n=1 Tax=Oculatella sp. LEGE 06141 TaxID=1828648 RepID=UPI00187E0AED|nr:pentapeptide repeat-containing protein [Oculatella sp. LEGE 06141]MBE9177615.1 pentapeptide repeat-containing protein [Oculatella sp. LEGE 06141]
MAVKKLAIATVLITFGIAAVIYTPIFLKQGRVRQLLQTKQCVGCNLQGANLEGLDLRGVNLEGANLRQANLERVKLANANLQSSNLEAANLKQADVGCTAIRFNLRSQPDSTNVSLSVEASPTPIPSDNSNTILGLDLQTNEQGATLDLNVGGCANLENANLAGATLPDGSIHP